MTTTTVVIECPHPGQAGPRQIEAQWTIVECCPACNATEGTASAPIPDRHYVFGKEQVRLPDAGIPVIECGTCGLAYKSIVPAPSFLARVFESQAAAKWTDAHDFTDEVETLRRLKGLNRFDLLDVGAAGGALLKACATGGAGGRRSALDVMRYPGIEAYLAGELIEGFLDDASLTWSQEPYDVVTLFDVLEHLYRPQIAFENLRALVKHDGLVFVETGNARDFWPRHFGINHWWYVRLLEHHVFWSRRSLEMAAAVHGFELVFWQEGRHKSRRNVFRLSMMAELLKTGLYRVASNHYAALAQMFGRQGNQPWYPFARDHFRACLRKV